MRSCISIVCVLLCGCYGMHGASQAQAPNAREDAGASVSVHITQPDAASFTPPDAGRIATRDAGVVDLCALDPADCIEHAPFELSTPPSTAATVYRSGRDS